MSDNKLCFAGGKLAFIQLTFLLLAFSLLIDSITGFLIVGLGVDLKLSSTYKFILLSLILFQIGSYSKVYFANLLLLLLALLIGSILTLLNTLDILGFFDDFITVLKLIMPLIVFTFCLLISQKNACLVTKYGSSVCLISFIIVLGNLVLGTLGFGFSSYGSSDLGIKGFFYAGNEVSGLYVIFFGLALHYFWQRENKFYYIATSLLTLTLGLLVATKAAMLSGVLMVYLIPVFNDRNRLLNLTRLKLKLMIPLIVLGIIITFFLVSILESTGIWSRLVWFYEKKGLIGLLLSGRDVYVINAIEAFEHFATFPQYIFGIGSSGLGQLSYKAVEVDPLDMFFWYGCIGFFAYLYMLTIFLRISYLATIQAKSQLGPGVLLINILLIGVSLIAGHIFTSGMLGPFIGLINGMAYADYLQNKGTRRQEVIPHYYVKEVHLK